jgi:hypothetical protein
VDLDVVLRERWRSCQIGTTSCPTCGPYGAFPCGALALCDCARCVKCERFDCALPSSPVYTLFVNFHGVQFSAPWHADDTMSYFMRSIADVVGIPPCEMLLSFAGKPITGQTLSALDDPLMSALGIRNGSTLTLSDLLTQVPADLHFLLKRVLRIDINIFYHKCFMRFNECGVGYNWLCKISICNS